MEDAIVEVAESGDSVLISLRGELDASVADQLSVIDDVPNTAARRHVEIDATDVSFIDSGGLGVVLAMVVGVRQRGGTIATLNASAQFRRLLELVGVTEIFGLSPATAMPVTMDHDDQARA